MSDDQDPASKTEDPTSKRLSEAEKKGQIAKSQEVNHWFMILGTTLVIALFGADMASGLLTICREFLGQSHAIPTDPAHMARVVENTTWDVLIATGPVFALLIVAALLANFLQHTPSISAEKIKPKLNKVSPLKGLKRIFSMQGLMEFAKGLIKIAIVAAIIGVVIWPDITTLPQLVSVEAIEIVHIVEHEAMVMLISTVAIMGIIAAADYVYQRFDYMKSLRMSKQEVKDEHKQSEGDPMIKARIKSLRIERARRRMMAAVPTADVVVTNPTHYAVALKYKMEAMSAPKVVAKGADAVAFRIREIAAANNVPIVENPAIARALFATCEVDEEIPVEHYKAVAEIISYVMRLKGRWRAGPHEGRALP